MQHTPANIAYAPATPESPTGIQGLDEITSGALPKGRATQPVLAGLDLSIDVA